MCRPTSSIRSIMKLDYDVVNDFAPVSLIADTPIWIIAEKIGASRRRQRSHRLAQGQNGKATMGTVGVGGPTDVAARIFEKETGTAFQIVPYRGGAPLLQDMLGGHIDFAFGQAATYLTYVQSGELKAYAVLQPKRWWAAPDVPTLDELGFHDIDASFWHGLWAPKGTPAGRYRQTQCCRPRIPGRSRRCRRDSAKSGRKSGRSNIKHREALAAKQKAEIAHWTPVIKETGIKAE